MKTTIAYALELTRRIEQRKNHFAEQAELCQNMSKHLTNMIDREIDKGKNYQDQIIIPEIVTQL